MKTKFKTRDLTMIAMMGAICCILLHIDFPLPFLPPFMNFDLAGLVEIIGGFAMGPLQAVCIILVKILLKLATEGTSSAFTGELQNFLLSCAYVLPPVIMYHQKKSKRTAIIGMAISSVFTGIVAIFTNLYIIIPFYGTDGTGYELFRSHVYRGQPSDFQCIHTGNPWDSALQPD